MDLDDHVSYVDGNQGMNCVRDSLPEGTCQQIFDIWSGVGDMYDRFSDRYGDKTPRVNHIAEFLGVTNRVVNQCKTTIKLTMERYSLVPV